MSYSSCVRFSIDCPQAPMPMKVMIPYPNPTISNYCCTCCYQHQLLEFTMKMQTYPTNLQTHAHVLHIYHYRFLCYTYISILSQHNELVKLGFDSTSGRSSDSTHIMAVFAGKKPRKRWRVMLMLMLLLLV